MQNCWQQPVSHKIIANLCKANSPDRADNTRNLEAAGGADRYEYHGAQYTNSEKH